jgi:hypothetical protein
MIVYNVFRFYREKIIEYANTLKTAEEQIIYLKYVRKEYRTNPPDLDPNYGIKPTLTKVLNEEIRFREELKNNPELNKENFNEIKFSKKKKWNQTKSEFARLVLNEYENDVNKKYTSKRDACFKLFEKYDFNDTNWTKERCYGLLRKC